MIDNPNGVRWVQIEPRRRYRVQLGSKTHDLVHQGRGAVGPDLDVGWYLEGGVSSTGGHAFMARRLHEAADKAMKALLKNDN